jgi:Fur family ferric uptake transcriptional regulator
MTSQIQKILKKHTLRKTIIRSALLQVFLEKNVALSHGEVEQMMEGNFDRLTIYRTLKTFDEKGLIHKVIDDGAVIKYALCEEECEAHDHKDNHVHFKCENCEQTFCLHHVPVEKFDLPKGFKATDYQLLVLGTCGSCN